MEETGRPISPHFTIWAWDIYGVSSGVNRATGALLWLGGGGLGLVEIFGGSGSALSLTQYIGSQAWPIATVFKFGVAFPIVYHYCGGIRHLRWDFFPELLDTPDAIKSAYLIFGFSVPVAAALALM